MPNCANQSGPFAQILYPPVRVGKYFLFEMNFHTFFSFCNFIIFIFNSDLPPTYDQVIIEINREATETVRTA